MARLLDVSIVDIKSFFDRCYDIKYYRINVNIFLNVPLDAKLGKVLMERFNFSSILLEEVKKLISEEELVMLAMTRNTDDVEYQQKEVVYVKTVNNKKEGNFLNFYLYIRGEDLVSLLNGENELSFSYSGK